MNDPLVLTFDVGTQSVRCGIVTPDGEVLAHTDEDLTPVMAEIDLNEKQRMFWLSVGPAQGEIHGIYRFEKNPKSFGGN